MKYIKSYENKIDDRKIDNPDIINFAKIYNKEHGYSNKAVHYHSNFGPGTYISIDENPFDKNSGYIIVGDLKLEKFTRDAKEDGMSDTLYMRALTDKVNEKYGNSNVINVAIDGAKPDLTKIKNDWDKYFDKIDDKQILKIMNKENIIEEKTLTVNKQGKVTKYKKGEDCWSIQYKESDDYIFTNFHSGWEILMKENDFITKFMKDVEYVITANKYNL